MGTHVEPSDVDQFVKMVHNGITYNLIQVYADSFSILKRKIVDKRVLQWFVLDEIPYDEMLLDDRHWLPILLEGKRFRSWFYFNEGNDSLHKYSLTPL